MLQKRQRNRLGLMSMVIALSLLAASASTRAAELPTVRIAHGAFNEKVAPLWLGAEKGFFHKHGVNVEIVDVRSGPLTIHALTSGETQMAYTIPGSVLSAAASGIDTALFAGLVNRADGEFIVRPDVRSARDLTGKRIGVQSLGGGVWTLTMLAMEHLGLDLERDNISPMVVGDQAVLARSLAAGRIDAAHLSSAYSARLKEKGFRTLLDASKLTMPYQGLSMVASRSYLRSNPQVVDLVLRGIADSVAYLKSRSDKDMVVRSLRQNLRLNSDKAAEDAYQSLQSLYNLDMKPNLDGIETTRRILLKHNPLIVRIRSKDVIELGPIQRLGNSAFYRELVSRSKEPLASVRG